MTLPFTLFAQEKNVGRYRDYSAAAFSLILTIHLNIPGTLTSLVVGQKEHDL